MNASGAALPAVPARYSWRRSWPNWESSPRPSPQGEGLRIAQSAGHSFSEVWAHYGLGYAHVRNGDFAAATRVLEPGLVLCRAMDFRLALPFVAAYLGSAYSGGGARLTRCRC